MADSKISDLSAVTTLAGTEEFVLAVTGATKKITAANLETAIGGGLALGQTFSYPTTFSGDTIDGSSTTPFVDVAAFDTKEVLNSRILHLQTLGASKNQRVRVTLGTTKAGAFDVRTAVAFGGILWSSAVDAYLEIRLSTSGDSQLAIARIGSQSNSFAGGEVIHNDVCRVGGSSISSAGANTDHGSPCGETFTLRFVRDGSNVITFYIGHGSAPMALVPVLKLADDTIFTATQSGTLARVEYAIHTPSGPGSTAQWDAFVDYLASV
jgi:hypothetical protein